MAARAVIARGSLTVLAIAAALATGRPALAHPGRHAGHGVPAHAAKTPHPAKQKAKQSPGRGKPPAASRRQSIAQGVVQSINARAIVLTQLDGTTLTVLINRHTRVLVDGRRARLAAVRPGFVLVVRWKPGKPAKVLRFLKPS